MSQSLLKIHNLQKTTAGAQLLQGANLTINTGEFISLLGPEGSGKTVLITILAGFSKPSFGRIIQDGKDITTLPPSRREACAIFSDTPLFPYRTVLSNIAFGLKSQGITRAERLGRARHMLALSDLAGIEKKHPKRLTHYQYKMSVLLRALVLRPPLLLLDDPFAKLEDTDRRQILAFIKALQQQWHFSVLYATNRRAEAISVSHRLALMSEGRIEQVGTPEEIYHQPETITAAQSMGTVNLLSCIVTARREDGLVALDMDGLTLSAQSYGPPPSIGEDVFLCLRPEQIQLSAHPHSDSLISGILKDSHLDGTRHLSAVLLPTGQELLCDDAIAEGYAPGTRVFITWDTAKTALLPKEQGIGYRSTVAGTTGKGAAL